ncbi:hypothetical protein [Flavobacterium sp. ACAM 123]|uniref:hypothetical protein n=1 Tax=Flavobacterium sp. ACAM 123 TaxID=1189620 RepID=UPI0012F78C52|nr:hypothetical protein [Flavobacterium sp. ACAM 123]
MRKIFCVLIFCASCTMFAQSKVIDFEKFYSGDNNYKKPIKYVLFDKSIGNTKKEIDNRIYFYMGGETFIYDSKLNKIETCAFDHLKKYKLENPKVLTDNEYLYFKKRVTEFQKETKPKLQIPNSMPVSSRHKYFKIFVLEKTNKKLF